MESPDNSDDDAAAPNGNLPGDNAVPQAVPAAALPPTLDVLAPPAAPAPPVAAPPVAAFPFVFEPGWPAIPATLPQMELSILKLALGSLLLFSLPGSPNFQALWDLPAWN